jgi:hypothetical protein
VNRQGAGRFFLAPCGLRLKDAFKKAQSLDQKNCAAGNDAYGSLPLGSARTSPQRFMGLIFSSSATLRHQYRLSFSFIIPFTAFHNIEKKKPELSGSGSR